MRHEKAGGKVASQGGGQSALAAFALVATLNADKLRSDTNAPPRESVEWKVES